MKLFTLLTLLLTAQHAFAGTIDVPEKYVELVADENFDMESPALSNDESKICWMGNSKEKSSSPISIFIKELGSSDAEVQQLHRPFLSIYTKCSFAPDGSMVTDEMDWRPGAWLKTIKNHIETKEWYPTGYHSTISFYGLDGVSFSKLKKLDFQDFNLNSKSLLEHPRVSPDGRWLTFYDQTNEDEKGVYLYEFKTGAVRNLGKFFDKHPTWNAFGDMIFFHTEEYKFDEREVAQMGYFTLKFGPDGDFISSERHLFIEPSKEYIYQKHPAYLDSAELLFFHTEDTDGSKKDLSVMSLDAGKRAAREVFKLKLSFEGEKIKGIKHPGVALRAGSAVYFVGKTKGDGSSKIFRLTNEGVQYVRSQIN